MTSNKHRSPILVTGAPRSGTTWAGLMLAAAPHTFYLHEPFHFNNAHLKEPLDHLFQYISEEDTERYKQVFSDLLHWRFPLRRRLRAARTSKQLGGIARDQWRFFLRRRSNPRPIIKDPIALFSAEWLSKTFGMNVLVLIRHPAAFCASIKSKNWRTDFNHFLDQPALLNRYLGGYENEMRQETKGDTDIISNAILQWNCTHHAIGIYQDEHPDWIFVRHEDLSTDPIYEFNSIYKSFGLEFTENVKERILHSTGAHNPRERMPDNPMMRNSKENISNWKHRLTPREIERIRAETFKTWPLFYSDEDW